MDNATKHTTTGVGRYVRQPAGYRAFIPMPLPPDPPLDLGGALRDKLSTADYALGRLDGAVLTLPNPDLFVFMYVRKEAVLSSQIEGTQSSLQNLLAADARLVNPDAPMDVSEVANYVRAMNHGLARLDELPVSVRLIREIHAELMQGVRFLHDGAGLPPLVQVGLAHAQFETIHPFLDGNGRIGRLLIAFLLTEKRLLAKPVLYLPAPLRILRALASRARRRRLARMARVLPGGRVRSQPAGHAHRRRPSCACARTTAPASPSIWVAPTPTASASWTACTTSPSSPTPPCDWLELTPAGANQIVARLEGIGLLCEITGYARNRRFRFEPYLQLFEDTGKAA